MKKHYLGILIALLGTSGEDHKLFSEIHPASTVVAVCETVSFHQAYGAGAPHSAGANDYDILLFIQFGQGFAEFVQRNIL